MRHKFVVVGCLLAALSVGAVEAAEPEGRLAADDAADAVVAAFAGHDAAALRTLASSDEVDPWIVAEELCARRAFDAAAAFSTASPRPDVERLPAYLTLRRGTPGDAATRDAWRKAVLLGAEGKPDDALAALSAAKPTGDDALAALAASERARALAELGRLDEAGKACVEAGEAAARVGWVRLAAESYQSGGALAFGVPDYAAALERWKKGLALHEARKDLPATAGLVGNLGIACDRLGDRKAALEYSERAVRLWEPLDDPLNLARALRSLGDTYAATGDLEKALVTLDRALGIQTAAGLTVETAGTLQSLGSAHSRRGNFPRAREVLQQALALASEADDARRKASTLTALAEVYAATGEWVKALDLIANARERFEAANDRAGVVGADLSAGALHRDRGDYPTALRLLEGARKDARTMGDPTEEARALGHLGHVYVLLGNYPKAYDLESQARDLFEKAGDRSALAMVLSELAVIARLRCDYPVAMAQLSQAQRLAEDVGDRTALARILQETGLVHLALGDYPRALEIQLAARELYGKLGFRGAVATATQNLGAIRVYRRDFAQAIEEFRAALAIHDELGDRAGAASTLTDLADVYRAQGEPAKAIPLLERAQKIRGDLKDRVGIATTSLNFGDAYLGLGDPTSAIERYKKASLEADSIGARDLHVLALTGKAKALLELGKADLALETAKQALPDMLVLAGGQGEEQGASARARYADLYEVGARAAVAKGDAEEVAFFLESGRAGTLLESLGGRRALQSAVLPGELREAEGRARADERGAFAAYLAALETGELKPARAARAALDAARVALKEVVERITRERKSEADFVYPKAATLSRMQEWLRPGEAIVTYAMLSTDAVALVATADGARVVRLATTAEVEAACADLVLSDDGVDPAKALAALRTLVVDRLGLDAKTTRVFVSPDGALSYVPFAVLLGTREVAYEPSGTTYGLLTDDRETRGEGVLALADPDYAKRPKVRISGENVLAKALERGGANLVALPGTRVEAQEVGDVVLLGAKATEKGLRGALGQRTRWRAVHLACHGLVDAERPTLSSLALTADDDDDGFLTASDLVGMRIPADLAVLSACETMKGRIYRGEGVVGLARAFMLAGAPRVLVSLWKVDDEATHVLMGRFYAAWKAGTPTAKALREAQDFVRGQKKWEHPRYWAAWVLWGLAD